MELSVSSKRPVSPSSTTSGVPPRPVAITAVPHAIDSKNTRGIPSTTLLGDAKSIAPLYKLHNSRRDFGPSNWTRSDKRVSTICLSIIVRSGPAPAIRRSRSEYSAAMIAKLEINVSTALALSFKRPAENMYGRWRRNGVAASAPAVSTPPMIVLAFRAGGNTLSYEVLTASETAVSAVTYCNVVMISGSGAIPSGIPTATACKLSTSGM